MNTDRRGEAQHRRSKGRNARMWSLLLPVAVATAGAALGWQPAEASTAPPPHDHIVSATLRPVADVPAFAVRPGGSTHAALDDAVEQPTPVGAANYVTATRSGATSAVTLATAQLGSQPRVSRAWFYASTGGATALRVDVTWNGVVHGSTTVPANLAFGWRSITFTPSTQADVDNLQLRFTALGGSHAAVRAAYVSIARTGRSSLTLRPDGDVGTFGVTPGGSAASVLDDPINQPTPAAAAGSIRGGVAGNSTGVTMARPSVSNASPASGSAWFYARTGSRTSLRVDVLWAGAVHASSILAADQAAAWHTIAFTPPSQQSASDLQLRFTALTGGAAQVSAAYIALREVVDDRPALNAYLEGLTPVAPSQANGDVPTGPTSAPTTTAPMPDPTAPSGQSVYQCSTTPYNLTTSPDKIVVINPDSSKLWLGGLLQGRGYADGLGSLRELPIRERAPLTIYTDLLGARVTRTIKNPTGASVQQAIADLVQQAKAAHVPVPVRASYTETDEQSSTQALLKLGISAKYLGASVTANLDQSRTAQQSSIIASFYQRMFTVSIVTPATPADYFSPAFTMGDLHEQAQAGRISPTDPPVVISNISYGRILLYSVTAKASASDLSAAVSAAYSGGAASGSVNVTDQQQAILNSATYSVVALGGSESDALSLIKNHRLGDYFTGHTDLATAVPISYQVDNIANGSAAKFSESTNYNLTECVAMPNKIVGERVRIDDPQAYLNGPRNPADIYGNVTVGNMNWTVPRDNAQTIYLHSVTNLPWTGTGNVYDLYFDGSHGGSSVPLDGSLNCRLNWWEFGADPSNQYHWVWNVNSGQYGAVSIDGGSAHCDVALQTRVTKVADLWDAVP